MRLHQTIRHTITALAACAALTAGSVAQSAQLQTTGYFKPPSQQFSLANGGTSLGSPNAGAFTGLLDSVPIVFFCVQLDEYFTPGQTYTYTDTIPDNATYTLLGRLFTQSFGTITDPTSSAAFQLAVWEIVFGSDHSLTASNDFHVTSAATAAVTQGQALLDNVFVNNPGSAIGFNIHFLENLGHQDFIYGTGKPRTVEEVPEPSPLLLIGIALLAMIGVSRRRAAKSSV